MSWIEKGHLASIEIVSLVDGTVTRFPEVALDNIGWDYGQESWDFRQAVHFRFYPHSEWTIHLPPPETKAEKRSRLIKEMYPKGNS